MREFYVGHQEKIFGRVIVLDDGRIVYRGFWPDRVKDMVMSVATFDKVAITPEYIYALPERLYGRNWSRELLEKKRRLDERG